MIAANRFEKSAGALLLLLAVSCLVGCQGVSAGSGQPPTKDLSLGPVSLNFGSVAAGTSKTLTVTATNTGTQSVTISGAAVSAKYFVLSSPNFPLAVGAGQSATLSINFTPNAAGSFSGSVALTSDASNSVPDLSLSGTGVADGQLGLNPASKAFGSVTVGATLSQTVTLTNTGGTSVNISQASVSGPGFQLSGITVPLTINASQSTTFAATFAPQTAGSATGAVTITSDASNSTLTMPLSGTGVTATGQLTVAPTTLGLGSVVVGTSGNASGRHGRVGQANGVDFPSLANLP